MREWCFSLTNFMVRQAHHPEHSRRITIVMSYDIAKSPFYLLQDLKVRLLFAVAVDNCRRRQSIVFC